MGVVEAGDDDRARVELDDAVDRRHRLARPDPRDPVALDDDRAVVDERPAHPSSATSSPKTSVCRSTSASVVAGHISAMLWNGVSRMPRFAR